MACFAKGQHEDRKVLGELKGDTFLSEKDFLICRVE